MVETLFISKGVITLKGGEKTEEITLSLAGYRRLQGLFDLRLDDMVSLQKNINAAEMETSRLRYELYDYLTFLAEFLRPFIKEKLVTALRKQYPKKSFRQYSLRFDFPSYSRSLKFFTPHLTLISELAKDGVITHIGGGWYRFTDSIYDEKPEVSTNGTQTA